MKGMGCGENSNEVGNNSTCRNSQYDASKPNPTVILSGSVFIYWLAASPINSYPLFSQDPDRADALPG